jgi:hypothetical protein
LLPLLSTLWVKTVSLTVRRQAELLESAPQLRAQAVAAEKAKLEALERTLGISNADDANPTASSSGEGSSSKTASSSAVKRIAEVDVEEIARKKHRFDDNKFFEESREIKDNVRSAVAAGKSWGIGIAVWSLQLARDASQMSGSELTFRVAEEEEEAQGGG